MDMGILAYLLTSKNFHFKIYFKFKFNIKFEFKNCKNKKINPIPFTQFLPTVTPCKIIVYCHKKCNGLILNTAKPSNCHFIITSESQTNAMTGSQWPCQRPGLSFSSLEMNKLSGQFLGKQQSRDKQSGVPYRLEKLKKTKDSCFPPCSWKAPNH